MATPNNDDSELDAATKILQLASMGNPSAINAIRANHAHFAEMMPRIQQRTAGAFQPGGAAVPDADLLKGGVPADQLAAARAAQGKAPADAATARYQEVLRLLQPEEVIDFSEPEVMTAKPKPKPPRAKAPAAARSPAGKAAKASTYTPLSVPEGSDDTATLGAALLNFLGGLPETDGRFQLREPDIKAPRPTRKPGY